MAHGGVARVRAGRVSVVLALATAVPAIDVNAAAHNLDRQYSANLHCLAFAVARPRVACPRVGSAARVWVRGHSRRDRVPPPYGTTRVVSQARERSSIESWRWNTRRYKISCRGEVFVAAAVRGGRCFYCAFTQSFEPVSLTATSEKKIRAGLPSAVPRWSVETSSGPAILLPAHVVVTTLGFMLPPRWYTNSLTRLSGPTKS